MTRKFLVAVDGSDHGWKALELAADLGRLAGAELLVLHVIPYEPVPDGLLEYAKVEGLPADEGRARFNASRTLADRIAEDAVARARGRGVAQVAARVVEGNPADEIVALARYEGAEMIFLGSRGLSGVGSLLVGSVSHKVMHLAPCTCVAVR
jgi:nucleotide-binding universal stress UspA family protein